MVLNMFLPNGVRRALTQRFGPDWQIQSGPLPSTPGGSTFVGISSSLANTSFSGARIYRVTVPNREQGHTDYGLKCSKNLDLERIKQIHSLQGYLYQDLGTWISCPLAWNEGASDVLIPTLLHDSQSGYWELMPWMAGSPVSRVGAATCEEVRWIAARLGNLHRSAQAWFETLLENRSMPEPYIWGPQSSDRHSFQDARLEDRWNRITQIVYDRFEKQKQQLRGLAKRVSAQDGLRLAQILERCEVHGERLLRAFKVLVQECRRHPKALSVWGHGDPWRGNWLLEVGGGGGLIDFAQAGYRWSGFDFSRSIGSLLLGMGWEGESVLGVCSGGRSAWQMAWEGYCSENPKPQFTLEDAYMMHQVSTVLTFCVYLERAWSNSGEEHWQDRWAEIMEMIPYL